jgi:radial spoke head protein 9
MELADLHYLSWCGATLNVQERAVLEAGLVRRRLEEGLDSIGFWGRVTGTDADYLVAVGTLPPLGAGYPRKKFYYCTTKAPKLTGVPDVSAEFAAKAGKITGRLKGDAALPLEEETDAPPAEDGAPEPPKLVEAHRLALIVARIDAATAVVPRGAYVVDGAHRIVRDAAYTWGDAGAIDAYYHWREGTSAARKGALERPGIVSSAAFLDPIKEDGPVGAWAVRMDAARGQATVRSLLWPGYYFFHNVGTPKFGGAYFGDGQKNDDIGFTA